MVNNMQQEQFNTAFAGLTPQERELYTKSNPTINVGGISEQYNPKTSAYSPVSVLSSANGASSIDSEITKHNADMSRINANVSGTPETKETPTKIDPNLRGPNGITADEAKLAGIDLSGYTLNPSTGYYQPQSSDVSSVNRQFESDKNEITSFYDTLVNSMDASTRNLISSIQGIYSGRIAEQQEANKRELAAFNTINTRFGTERYAPGVSRGILTADERAGMDRIKEIALEEAGLIAKANQSLEDKKYQAFMSQRNEIASLRKETKTELEKLQTRAYEEQKKAKNQVIQSSRDSAVADLVSQGITDVKTLLDYLNFDEQGNRTGDFTAEEVGKVLKVLNPNESLAGLDADYKTYSYLKSIDDPAVSGLNYLQYKTAVHNATTGGGIKDFSISPDKKVTLLGAGFSQNEVTQIEEDVRNYGLDKVLEGVSDESQKKALQTAYGVKEKITREQLDKTVTQKMAYDGLKDTYTPDELKTLADEKGLSSFWTGKDTDIERFLNSSEARTIYADLLWEQYKSAGMTSE